LEKKFEKIKVNVKGGPLTCGVGNFGAYKKWGSLTWSILGPLDIGVSGQIVKVP